MRRLILTIIVVTFAGLTSTAQEVSYLPLFEDYTTKVVRQYSDKESIYYMENGDAHFFVLYNRGTPTTAIVSKFPSNYDLHDFEVFRDTVYFCGVKHGSSPKGMVGFIPVLDLFYTGGSYTLGLIDDLMMFGSVTSCHMSSIDRMDVFVDSDSLTHFAVVGRLEQTATFGQDSRRTVADVWYDHHPITPHWRGRVLYQKEDLYQPKDITCTENYVVAVATNKATPYPELVPFRKIANFTLYPYLPVNNNVQIQDWLTSDSVLIERMNGDDVAVAQHYVNEGRYGVAIHYFNNISLIHTMANTTYTLHYNFQNGILLPLEMYDLRFNRDHQDLLLLHTSAPDWRAPLNTIFEYNFLGGYANVWYDLDLVPWSIDNRRMHFFSAAGQYQTWPLVTIKTEDVEKCFVHAPFDNTVILPELAPMPYDSVTMEIKKEPELPDCTFPISAGVTVPCENGDAKIIIDDKKRRP